MVHVSIYRRKIFREVVCHDSIDTRRRTVRHRLCLVRGSCFSADGSRRTCGAKLGSRRRRRCDRRDRAPARGTLDRRTGVRHRTRSRGVGGTRRARHHGRGSDRAERYPGSQSRHQFDADRVHSRHRATGSGFRFRAGRRNLSRRCLSQPAPGGRSRHLRYRADRGTSRPPRYSLRSQHHRRGREIRQPPASTGFLAARPRHLRHLRPGRRRPERIRTDQRSGPGGRVNRTAFPRRVRRQSHDRSGKLQQGHLGRPGELRTGRLWRAGIPAHSGRLHQGREQPARRHEAHSRARLRCADPERCFRHARCAARSHTGGRGLWRRHERRDLGLGRADLALHFSMAEG